MSMLTPICLYTLFLCIYMEEFNLSENKTQVINCPHCQDLINCNYYREQKVKEFIKRLKEEIGNKCDCIISDPHRKGQCWIWDEIDKLAGDKLNG